MEALFWDNLGIFVPVAQTMNCGIDWVFLKVCRNAIQRIILQVSQYISDKMQLYTVYVCKLLFFFQVVPPPIIRSAYNCICSIWY